MTTSISLPLLGAANSECRACDLRLACGQVVCGRGSADARVAIIGDWPGKEEDLLGTPFEGREGNVLQHLLNRAGIELGDVWRTYAVKCAPSGRMVVGDHHIKTCRTWLWQELQTVRPKAVVTLGKVPTRLLLKLKKAFRLQDYVGKSHELPYLPGTFVFPWQSLSRLSQQGKKGDSDTVAFFRFIKELTKCSDVLRAG